MGDWDGDEGDDDEEILDLFPEGSEMRKLALLAEDPTFEATEELPAEIDRTKLQAEMVAMLKEAATEAPEEDRALIAEFAHLIESDPNADPAKMSEALERYLFERSEEWRAVRVGDQLLDLGGRLDAVVKSVDPHGAVLRGTVGDRAGGR